MPLLTPSAACAAQVPVRMVPCSVLYMMQVQYRCSIIAIIGNYMLFISRYNTSAQVT
jgi:hypothetical protein